MKNNKNKKVVTRIKVLNFDGSSNLTLNALWDTGATGSIISPNFAEKLKLAKTGRIVTIHGAYGSTVSHEAVANLYFLDSDYLMEI